MISRVTPNCSPTSLQGESSHMRRSCARALLRQEVTWNQSTKSSPELPGPSGSSRVLSQIICERRRHSHSYVEASQGQALSLDPFDRCLRPSGGLRLEPGPGCALVDRVEVLEFELEQRAHGGDPASQPARAPHDRVALDLAPRVTLDREQARLRERADSESLAAWSAVSLSWT